MQQSAPRPTGDAAGQGERQRARLVIRGAVQGVGFRPFVYRLATSLALAGWVHNSSQGVVIEVEGDAAAVREFLLRVEPEKPARSFIQSLETTRLDPAGFDRFDIRPSTDAAGATTLVLPDIATCPDCLREVFDPADRRYRYPFTNCTNCGPRFSIIEALPYDRPNTTMKVFALCDRCRAEYEDPGDRRFHAQPTACPACGPALELWAADGTVLARHDAALLAAADAVARGAVLAAKGLGGFHLIADARSDRAVAALRARKAREEKPFALMAPSLDWVRAACDVDPLEARLLLSPESPIVLLSRRRGRAGADAVAPSVAPGNPQLGVMLPSNPLHHLLMAALGFPVVATSGNRSDEPICTDEHEARARLTGLADLFLVHSRPIARHVDDSVARVVLGRELVLRRARGYAPLPVRLPAPARPILAVGAHLKNTIAVTAGDNVFVSQHIGDLETVQAFEAFREVIGGFRRLYRVEPAAAACDAHPSYLSTGFARGLGIPVVAAQHHYAHVLSAMAENEIDAPVLGVAWDGTGYGPDGTVWGGEFLEVTTGGFVRTAHLRTFRLPGGDRAVREPRRSALGVLHEIGLAAAGEAASLAPVQAFTPGDLRVLQGMLDRGLNSPRTSSAGRLFDAVASLAGLSQVARFEGQAAMALEFALAGREAAGAYPFALREGPRGTAAGAAATTLVIDWEPMVRTILEEIGQGVAAGPLSARFHNTLAHVIVAVARRAGHDRVVLSGGCFQNRYLLECAVRGLQADGFRPYWHQRIPPNDGGIALGQVMAALR